jgi:hypothetical protein
LEGGGYGEVWKSLITNLLITNLLITNLLITNLLITNLLITNRSAAAREEGGVQWNRRDVKG